MRTRFWAVAVSLAGAGTTACFGRVDRRLCSGTDGNVKRRGPSDRGSNRDTAGRCDCGHVRRLRHRDGHSRPQSRVEGGDLRGP